MSDLINNTLLIKLLGVQSASEDAKAALACGPAIIAEHSGLGPNDRLLSKLPEDVQ
jgi:hypothetical protein